MTVYSYFLIGEAGDEPDFLATGHPDDDRALAHVDLIFSRAPEVSVVEVWDGPLKLARLHRERARPDVAAWREVLYP
ncbi:hypothetical protein LRS10_13085 [Phenylobacterium sp. J426]|uniref:hypothetical protein n=1 Tax=Phenylobacterium sp. J426 TaxID=2898439 RepID=UPI0021511A0C|nr:hypothetical protein [Phenylobacterium sp. J426]MCR5875032.1 hypothetical protein [Phenylobacterium sp. J426]